MSSLYLHVPFCRQKCPYCDFYSVHDSHFLLESYPELLRRQLELSARGGWKGPFQSVFFGGGTPSLIPPRQIASLLEAIQCHFGLVSDAEISLEANPGTVCADSLAGYRSAGVNRLSLGIQSLNPEALRQLGRSHSVLEARKVVAWARSAGFENLSCDLIFALPGQTLFSLDTEISDFLALEPDHLSCYGLTVEEGTPFSHLHRSGNLILPEEDFFAQSFCQLHDRLTRAGYGHYEISNYAQPGRECRHNLGYWRRSEYLGVGAGAHSFCSRGWGRRLEIPADLGHYATHLARSEDPSQEIERFDRDAAISEVLYLGLRTAEGVSESAFRRRFGQGVEAVFPEGVKRCGNVLRRSGDAWHFTLEGWLLYDYHISAFL